jgi:hypothetical protein
MLLEQPGFIEDEAWKAPNMPRSVFIECAESTWDWHMYIVSCMRVRWCGSIISSFVCFCVS